jgi:hypothetical protein
LPIDLLMMARARFSPRIKPKAPGERLPVPAGWRFCIAAPVMIH